DHRAATGRLGHTAHRATRALSGCMSDLSPPMQAKGPALKNGRENQVLSEFWVFQEKVDMKVSAFSFTTSLLVFGYL
ncbi:hypothetical protein, partial [Waltera sp.]|uniref:hypothetical protein n=1 Tax=Waltera sp. TaxID=2815806 RepID=UPI003AB99B0D